MFAYQVPPSFNLLSTEFLLYRQYLICLIQGRSSYVGFTNSHLEALNLQLMHCLNTGSQNVALLLFAQVHLYCILYVLDVYLPKPLPTSFVFSSQVASKKGSYDGSCPAIQEVLSSCRGWKRCCRESELDKG